eukprot:7391762-Prymnesium_polylepis.1
MVDVTSRRPPIADSPMQRGLEGVSWRLAAHGGGAGTVPLVPLRVAFHRISQASSVTSVILAAERGAFCSRARADRAADRADDAQLGAAVVQYGA